RCASLNTSTKRVGGGRTLCGSRAMAVACNDSGQGAVQEMAGVLDAHFDTERNQWPVRQRVVGQLHVILLRRHDEIRLERAGPGVELRGVLRGIAMVIRKRSHARKFALQLV